MNTATLRDIAEARGLVGGPFGSSLVSRDYVPAGVPVIRGENLNHGRRVGGDFVYVSPEKFARDLSRNSAQEGDLIFTQRGTLGQVAIVENPPHDTYVVSQSQMRLRVNRSVADPLYVYYACSSPEFLRQIEDRAISTGVPHINLGILGSLHIRLPKLAEQRAIAEVLGALDDKIAANTRAEVACDKLIRALYSNAVLHPETTKQSLLDAIDVHFGEPFSGTHFTEPGVGRPLIRVRDLKTFAPKVWTTESRKRETLVQPGDVLVGMDAEFHPTTWLGEPGVLNQRVCAASSPTLGRAFVREALREPLLEIENYKTGTTVIHLNKADLLRHKISVPGPAALSEFKEKAEPVYELRVHAAIESRTLAATRDALLPALMSGKLRISDAESIVSDLT